MVQALGHQLQEIWREFEQRLSEAREFVDTQTPVKAQGLQESIQVRPACAHTHTGSSSCGKCAI